MAPPRFSVRVVFERLLSTGASTRHHGADAAGGVLRDQSLCRDQATGRAAGARDYPGPLGDPSAAGRLRARHTVLLPRCVLRRPGRSTPAAGIAGRAGRRRSHLHRQSGRRDLPCRDRSGEIDGDINLTNDEPVPILAFLLDILDRLGIPAPRWRVSVRTATRMAGLIEAALVSARCIEPPIDRSFRRPRLRLLVATFDVSKMRTLLGPPRVSIAEGVARTVAAVKEAERSATSG